MSDPEIRARVEKVLDREIDYKHMPEHDPSPVRNKPWTPRVVEEGAPEHCDPLDYMQASIDDPRLSHRDKLFAASNLAPYVHPKRTGQFISNVISLPPPVNAADAKLQIGIIMQYVRAGYATMEEGDKLIAHLNTFINAETVVDVIPRVAALEAKEAARAEQGSAVGFIIQSDMPALPGTDIIMPDVWSNLWCRACMLIGHALNR
jgi:hypothetical protein